MAVMIDKARYTGCGSCVEDCILGTLLVIEGTAMVDSDSYAEWDVCMVDSCISDAISLPYRGMTTIWV